MFRLGSTASAGCTACSGAALAGGSPCGWAAAVDVVVGTAADAVVATAAADAVVADGTGTYCGGTADSLSALVLGLSLGVCRINGSNSSYPYVFLFPLICELVDPWPVDVNVLFTIRTCRIM